MVGSSLMKRSKIFSLQLSGIPIPVSLTMNCMSSPCSLKSKVIEPRSVNFRAFASRFMSICITRRSSVRS